MEFQSYKGLLQNSIFYFLAQRDGTNVNTSVLNRNPSHLADQKAIIYQNPNYDSNDNLIGNLVSIGGPIDVSGGWFDAGDYLKFVETASYVVTMMGLAIRDYYPLNTDPNSINYRLMEEFMHGIDWLNKAWDNQNKKLYYQVGIGAGNAQILSDHDLWRYVIKLILLVI